MSLEDRELVSMSQQYEVDRDGRYVTHLAYEEINRQVAAGRDWSKCPNCGNPYPLDKPGATPEICGIRCAQEYTDYLNGF